MWNFLQAPLGSKKELVQTAGWRNKTLQQSGIGESFESSKSKEEERIVSEFEFVLPYGPVGPSNSIKQPSPSTVSFLLPFSGRCL